MENVRSGSSTRTRNHAPRPGSTNDLLQRQVHPRQSSEGNEVLQTHTCFEGRWIMRPGCRAWFAIAILAASFTCSVCELTPCNALGRIATAEEAAALWGGLACSVDYQSNGACQGSRFDDCDATVINPLTQSCSSYACGFLCSTRPTYVNNGSTLFVKVVGTSSDTCSPATTYVNCYWDYSAVSCYCDTPVNVTCGPDPNVVDNCGSS